MTNVLQNIHFPELVFGFVAPIGTDTDSSVSALRNKLTEYGYTPVPIKVTDLFPPLSKKLPSIPTVLQEEPVEDRYNSYIEFGNNLRKHFDDDSFLASCCVNKILQEREKILQDKKSQIDESEKSVPDRIAYILHQFKRKEEIDLFRSVYGPLFFQISVYSRRSARVDYLARKIAISHNSANSNSFREAAERLVTRDENELGVEHGQRISDVFHEADFIVNTDLYDHPPTIQIIRLVDLLFGSNAISPTKVEYGLYTAKSASLRSVDLSRQVGAAIFSKAGEIMTLGANEVPKAGGGTYWCDDGFDNRDFRRGEDANVRRKRELLSELARLVDNNCNIEKLFEDPQIRNSQFMDALEYSRVIRRDVCNLRCGPAWTLIERHSSIQYHFSLPYVYKTHSGCRN